MTRAPEYLQLRRWGLILIFSGLAFIPFGAIVLAIFPSQPNSLAALAGLVILGNSGLIAGVALLALDMKLKSRSDNSN
jgi:hypothetical protein